MTIFAKSSILDVVHGSDLNTTVRPSSMLLQKSYSDLNSNIVVFSLLNLIVILPNNICTFESLQNKMMFCAIWYHLYNFKNLKNTHRVVLLLVKLRLLACNFSKSNTFPWVFFTFFELHKWYQIAQCITYLCEWSILQIFPQ